MNHLPNGEHSDEDERDDSAIRALPEPQPFPPEFPDPAAAPAVPLSVAAGRVKVLVVCRPLTSEAVPDCSVRIANRTAKTDSHGRATVDVSGLPDGTNAIIVEAPQTSHTPVGPDLRPNPDTSRIWRRLNGTVRLASGSVVAVEGEGLSLSGGTLRVALQPVWLRAPLASTRSGSVDMIVIHHTAGNLEGDLKTFLYSGRVSIHYLVAPNGDVFKLVNEDRAAAHAGYSHWMGRDGMNSRSIGIEMTHISGEYPEAQVAAVVDLMAALHQAFPEIPAGRVVGHSDIGICEPSAARPCSPAAPKRLGRKSTDPGSSFPWERIEALGLGLQIMDGNPHAGMFGRYFAAKPGGALRRGDNDSAHRFGGETLPQVGDAVAELQRDLIAIGYYCGAADGDFGQITQMALRMFNQHMFSGSRRRDATSDTLDIEAARMLKQVRGETTPPAVT